MRSLPAVKPFLLTLPLLFGALVGLACNDAAVSSFYDPGAGDLPAPTIASVTPPGLAVAGMDTVIVQGTNFSTTPANNFLFFNDEPAALVGASSTQLMAIAPLVLGDSVAVRVSVLGSVSFSNTAAYSLAAGVVKFGDLLPATTVAPAEKAVAVATDTSGSLYVAYTYGVADAGILKFTPGGVRSRYAAATPSVASWGNIRFGPSGYLFAVRNFRAIYRFPLGGGAAAALWLAFPTGTFINDIDFDQDGNMWAAGNNASIYRILANKTFASYPFTGNVRCVRVYNGYLYFGAAVSGVEQVWRAPITAGVLGTAEVYFDLQATMPGVMPKNLTFASDGTMYIASSTNSGIIVVAPGGMSSTPFGTYQSLFANGLSNVAWGATTDLYSASADGLLLKFLVRGKSSAPYYGSTL